MRTFVLLISITAFLAGLAMAQITAADRARINAYQSALREAQAGRAPKNIEAVFAALNPLRKALMEMRGKVTLLESLSATEFERLQRDLPGVLINREEVVFVKADPEYFVKLSTARGDAPDQAFFVALKTTYPDSIWPRYTQQQTDYSGCTRFGSTSLIESYRMWSEFQRRYPTRYVTAAHEEVEGVLSQLTGSTCACGNADSIQSELQGFLDAFPTAPASAQVRERLQAWRSGRLNIRTQCVSG